MARRKQDLEVTPRLPGFLPYQHPLLVKQPPRGPGWIYEVKLDGYRMQLRMERGRATWFTRTGLDWSDRFADMADHLSDLPDGILDGELVALDAHGAPSFSMLRSAMGKRQAGQMIGDLTFFAFDLLYEGTTDLRSYSLKLRKTQLEALLHAGGDGPTTFIRAVQPLPSADPDSLVKAACTMEWEGVVAKRLDAPYRPSEGPRSDTWQKVKCRPLTEVVVTGWETEGARFRSLLAGVYSGGKLRYVGHIHTGYSGRVVDALMPKLRALETDASPIEVGEKPRRSSNLHWVRPELVARVEIAEWTASGKLLQSSFKGLREDKPARDVVVETL